MVSVKESEYVSQLKGVPNDSSADSDIFFFKLLLNILKDIIKTKAIGVYGDDGD